MKIFFSSCLMRLTSNEEFDILDRYYYLFWNQDEQTF